MNYYALDEALAILNEEPQESFDETVSIIEFVINDINSVITEADENTDDNNAAEPAKKNLWQKIKDFVKKVINFIKVKVAVLFSKGVGKLSNMELKRSIESAKKVDKKNQLSKLKFNIADFGNVYAQIEKFVNDRNTTEYDLTKRITCDINNVASEIDKAITNVTKVVNMLPKINKVFETYLNEANAEKGDPKEVFKKCHISFDVVKDCTVAFKQLLVLTANIGYVCKLIKEDPEKDHSEAIKKFTENPNE